MEQREFLEAAGATAFCLSFAGCGRSAAPPPGEKTPVAVGASPRADAARHRLQSALDALL